MINFIDVPPRCHQDGHCFPHSQIRECVDCKYREFNNLQAQLHELYFKVKKCLDFFGCPAGSRSDVCVACQDHKACNAVKTDKELYDEVVEYLNCVYVDLWNLRYLISLDMCPVDLRVKECEHYGNP